MTNAWADRERATLDWNSHENSREDLGDRKTAKAPLDAAADAFATMLAQRLAEALEPILLKISNQHGVRQDQLPPTMSVLEAAEFLGLGRSAVYDGVRTGEIAALRIGRRIRIPTHALLKKLESLS